MHVSSRVIVRNDMGRFIADCAGAATATVKDAIEEGESLSKAMAPVGHKPDFRSTPIKASFFTEVLSRTSGVWGNFARHALYQEEGTGPHTMVGSPTFHFFWENAGRWWVPGLFGEPDIINHPGNAPQPFLKPAYAIIARRLLSIADRHYPG